MLDVRRLRLLRELAARGTVTAVAEALSYTPSAVSQQLAALERDAGVPLLEKVGRGGQLTGGGGRVGADAGPGSAAHRGGASAGRACGPGDRAARGGRG